MIRVLVSACLLGEPVRFDGRAKTVRHPALDRWIAEGRVVSVCPEMAGGLPTPRPPAERTGDLVLTNAGMDVTTQFRTGAETALSEALRHGARIAVLKEGSPSCGSTYVYDGTFSKTRLPGVGLATERLRGAGIEVFSENQIEEAAARLDELERGAR